MEVGYASSVFWLDGDENHLVQVAKNQLEIWPKIETNFPLTGPKKGLDTRVESNLQKSMLVTVNYDEPVKQVTHWKVL